MTDEPEACDTSLHVVVLDEHGAGSCPCGMVRRYPRPDDETELQRLAAYQRLTAACLSKLSEYGWVLFGTNANNGPVGLVFSQQTDNDGDPYFERVVRP